MDCNNANDTMDDTDDVPNDNLKTVSYEEQRLYFLINNSKYKYPDIKTQSDNTFTCLEKK